MVRSRSLLLASVALILAAAAVSLAVGWLPGRVWVDADQPEPVFGLAVPLEPGSSVGQTFVARHAGLVGLDLYLLPNNSEPLSITLHLRSDPNSGTDLLTSELRLPPQAVGGFHRFEFPSQGSSHSQYYYAFLEADRPGVWLALAHGDSYLDGAAYQQHSPLDGQAAFRLAYAPGPMILDLAKATAGWMGILALTGLLFVVPGWALLAWLLPRRGLNWGELLGLAAGISLSLYPLLLLWTALVGLHAGALYVWIPIAVGLMAVAWRYRRSWRSDIRDTFMAWTRSDARWPDLTLVLILTLVFGLRLLVVRSLEVPLWHDSYQHAVMAQLLTDNAGLFESWEPYAPYQSLTVHFGFSTMAALFDWLVGWGSVKATLIAGQVVNGLAILTLYPLAVRLSGGERWAGVGAVLIAGLVSPMPAHYVNWGRFPQLMGQAILPIALWLAMEAVEGKGSIWIRAALGATAAAGMALAYYRMPFYYAVFLLAWLLVWGVPKWKLSLPRWVGAIVSLALVAGASGLLLVPLGVRLSGGQLATGLESGLTKASPLAYVLADYRVWRNINFYLPRVLQVASVAALMWSLLRRRWGVASLGLWTLGLASLVAGRLIQLPGANFMQSFAILIALYIPASLLIGWLVGEAARLPMRWSRPWITALAIAVLAVWASVDQVQIIMPARVLVTRPDTNAMTWIQRNTPADSRFLVEGYRIYNGSYAVGGDAGWWIPLLAGRGNTMPPQYALMSESPSDPGFSRQVVDLVALLEDVPPTSPAAIDALCDQGVTHVYVGQRQGDVGPEARQLFSAGDFAGSSIFEQVYRQDRVSIFSLNRQECASTP